MDEQKKEITGATATRIRYYRNLKGVSQEELALRANLNPAYFGQVERGLKCPTVDTLNKIALALDIPLPELVRFNTVPSLEEREEQVRNILTRIPVNKYDQAIKIFEAIAELF